MSADETLLDNALWNALNGAEASVALGTQHTRRYPTAIGDFAGFADPTRPNFAELSDLVEPGV
jgi:hypothetical protein